MCQPKSGKNRKEALVEDYVYISYEICMWLQLCLVMLLIVPNKKSQVFFLPDQSSIPLKTSKNPGGFQSTVLSCEYLADIPVKLEEL